MGDLIADSKQEKLLTLWHQLGELLWQWNPIGLPVPRDEYESLIPSLVHKFERDVPSHEIIAFLEQILKDKFGVTPPFDEPTERFINMARQLFLKYKSDS
jgi:hypothetical protein